MSSVKKEEFDPMSYVFSDMFNPMKNILFVKTGDSNSLEPSIVSDFFLDSIQGMQIKCIEALLANVNTAPEHRESQSYCIIRVKNAFDADEYHEKDACVKMSTTDFDLTRSDPFTPKDFSILSCNGTQFSYSAKNLQELCDKLNREIEKSKM